MIILPSECDTPHFHSGDQYLRMRESEMQLVSVFWRRVNNCAWSFSSLLLLKWMLNALCAPRCVSFRCEIIIYLMVGEIPAYQTAMTHDVFKSPLRNYYEATAAKSGPGKYLYRFI